MDRDQGIFIISLDFELYWGMRDVISYEGYEANLRGTPAAIESMLRHFEKNGVHATWATVGFLFFEDRERLLASLPQKRPAYRDPSIDLYRYAMSRHLDTVGHFAPHLIRAIADTPYQEIASHTFSHYYCLEEGQSRESFEADLWAAQQAAKRFGLSLKSLVFPRNQYNPAYIDLLPRYGFTSYRGNESGWLYEAASEAEKKSPLRRAGRILDSYMNLSGHHIYAPEALAKKRPYDIPASRFLRPYNPKLSHLDRYKLGRIKAGMERAAKEKRIYHLWWHPHNFGIHTQMHLAYLEAIIGWYLKLRERYGMASMTMAETAEYLDDIGTATAR